MRDALARRQLTEIAASTAPIGTRAQAMLETMRHLIPFDGAWIALADPLTDSYVSLGSFGLDESTLEYLSGPMMAREIAVIGGDRAGPPRSLSGLPRPSDELPSWAACLVSGGFHQALTVALFTPGGHHVGFLALFFTGSEPLSLKTRRRLGRLRSILAHGIDPMRSLRTAAHLVQEATAAVVLRADGDVGPLPGVNGHALLIAGSPVVVAAQTAIQAGGVYRSFLWPLGGTHAPDGHVRVIVFASTDGVPAVLTGVLVLSPAQDCRGLTPRELEVLGWVIDGHSNQEIASALVVAQRTVAAHVEHILSKFGAPTRTLAAVRAEREGLYVPKSACAEQLVGLRP
jgi:DNA-binding CsgD family transcriptional regulator